MNYELDELECFGMHLANSGDLICDGINFIDIDQSKIGLFNSTLVYQALIYMHKRHPLMRAYLKKNIETKKYFIEIKNNLEDEIELEWNDLRKDENITRQDVIKYIEKFNRLVFNMNSILWRTQIILYKCKESNLDKIVLTLSFPIFVTDGINVTTLSIELVNFLNCLMNNQNLDQPVIVVEPAQSLYTLCEYYNLIKEKHIEFIKSSKNDGKKFILSDKLRSNNSSEIGSKLDLIKIDKQKSKKIIDLSKKYGTKITAYLSTITLYALKSLYEFNQIKFDEDLIFNVAFNMRFRYKPNLEFNRMGWQVGVVGIGLNKNDLTYSDIWNDSVKIDKMIEKLTDPDCESFFSGTHNYEFFKNINSIFEESNNLNEATNKIIKFKSTDFTMSNTGRYVCDRVAIKDGPLKIDEMYFSDASNAPDSYCGNILFHTTYWNDQLMIQLSSNLVAISYQNVNKLLSLFEYFIDQSLI